MISGHQKHSEKILVGVTTYAGDLEQQLILRKTLRHLRYKNGDRVFILVVSDGYVKDAAVHDWADCVLERPGPSGLQQGELDSILQIIKFARSHHFASLIKTAGDVLMSQNGWARCVMDHFLAKNKQILSTHWFYDESWVVGTKFFVAHVDFLETTIPLEIKTEFLEDQFSQNISKHFDIKEVASLINSATSERDEVSNELALWGWEHAHELWKFFAIDEGLPAAQLWASKNLLYPLLRLRRNIKRMYRKAHPMP